MKFQSLTESDIRHLADSIQIFDRGKEYLESDAVTRFSATPHRINAQVRSHYGSYKVGVTDEFGDLETDCSCPYDGEVCKRIVAVLLRYRTEHLGQVDNGQGRDRHAMPEVTLKTSDADHPDPLEQALRALSHAELLELVIRLAQDRADIRRSLLAVVPLMRQLLQQQPSNPTKIKVLKQQISNFFNDLYHQYQEYDENKIYPDLTDVFDEAQTLNLVDLVDVFWHVILCVNDMFDDYAISTLQIRQAIGLYAQAVSQLDLLSPDQVLYINSLLAVLDFSIAEYGDFPTAVKAGIDRICTRPDDRHYLLQELTAYSNEAFYVDWIADLYRCLGDDDNYLRIRQANLNSESQYLDLARYWLNRGDRQQYQTQNRSSPSYLNERIDILYWTARTPSVLMATLADFYRQAQDVDNLCRVLVMETVFSSAERVC